MAKCNLVDELSGAICTLESGHAFNHVDESIDGISLSWPAVEINLNNCIIPGSVFPSEPGGDA
jgi:hypothetical protein